MLGWRVSILVRTIQVDSHFDSNMTIHTTKFHSLKLKTLARIVFSSN